MKHVDVAIIGAGPAGYTAAIYAARANMKTILFQGTQPGGQITLTNDLENFPGFSEGVTGPALAEEMEKQAVRFGAETIFEMIEDIDFSNRPFKMKTSGGVEYLAESIILSTGSSSRMLDIPGEKEGVGRGVSTCATCDAFFYRGKHVMVVGGGDSALDEGLFLTRFVDKLTIVHRRDKFRASPILQQRVFKNEKVEVIWDTVIEEVLHGENGVNGARLKNLNTGEISDFYVDGIFIFIGHIPNTGFLQNKITLDENGYIITNEKCHTNIEGVFAAGDVQDPVYRQAITAAGTGCVAAIEAYRYLEEKKTELVES